MQTLLCTLAFATALIGTAYAATDCPAQPARDQMALSYEAFDAAGWRTLLAEGCTDVAIATLESYATANDGRLSPERARELRFHVGQSLAISGRDAESLPHFERAVGGADEWDAYVRATIAFLRRDAAALTVQRQRYADADEAIDMRVAIIDGFIACPGQAYMAAVQCGMSATGH